MRIVVVGSAAGGGYPQWNCRCSVCRLFWDGDPRVERRTQSGLAVSIDGSRWILLNCSPDIREQIARLDILRPKAGLRGSPIAAVVLTNGDIDHIGGLLSLREATPFAVYATQAVLDTLRANPVFNVLAGAGVSRRAIAVKDAFSPLAGLSLSAIRAPGKLPLYLEGDSPDADLESDYTIGLEIAGDSGRRAFYLPGCARLTPAIVRRLDGADAVFFDGTLWRDDEMIAEGLGRKTGRRMGHMPVSGPDGSLAAFSGLEVGRKVYIHINNTNPMLIDGSPERQAAMSAGWDIAYDGMEVAL